LMPHATGLLIGTTEGDREISRITVHHNLMAHNGHRNPRVSGVQDAALSAPKVQVINNVVYNWRNRVGTTVGRVEVDLIANFWRAGPMSAAGRDRAFRHEHALHNDAAHVFPAPSIYIAKNLHDPNFTQPDEDNWALLTYHYHLSGTPLPLDWRRSAPLRAPIPVTIQGAREALASVIADVGHNKRLAADGSWMTVVDAVDQAVLNDVTNGTGPAQDSERDHQDDFGGYPKIDPGTPYADTDRDGMADVWENVHGFDAFTPTDGPQDADGDGYTNLEEFLNVTNPRDEN
jgi:pectate lyase